MLKVLVPIALLVGMIASAWAAYRCNQIDAVIGAGHLSGNADKIAEAQGVALLASLWAGVGGVAAAVLWIISFAARMSLLGWICLIHAIVSLLGGGLLVRDSRAIYEALPKQVDAAAQPRQLIPDEPLPANWILFSADPRTMNPLTFIRYGGVALGRKAKLLALAESGLLLATLLWFRETSKAANRPAFA